MIRKSFALTLIAGLFLAGPLTAEPDSKKEAPKRSQSDSKKSSSGKEAAAANRPLTVKDISIFTYQPADPDGGRNPGRRLRAVVSFQLDAKRQ
jgi:hypothetical protein